MIYYLITEKHGDAICLVKNTNEKTFLQQWAGKIVYSSRHILELLPKIRLTNQGEYTFSDN